jgi:hypothetical protein
MAAPSGSEPAWRSDSFRALSLGTLATLLYLCTAPAVVNPDGLGYLKLLPHNFAAGHLLYMPLLRAATHLVGDGLRAGRLVNALLGGTGVVLMYGIVRRTLAALPLGRPYAASDVRFAATFAAAGLAVSYGYWVQGSDVEAYATAMVALLCTVRLLLAYRAQPTLLRALAVGLFLGLSVLCHLTHVLLTPLVFAFIYAHAPTRKRGAGHAAIAVGLGGVLAIDLYAYAAFAVRLADWRGALAWIGTAAHGFYYGGGAYRLADAIYGLAKSIVWSPYLYEADAQKLVGQLLLGLVPLLGFAALLWSRRRALPPLPWRLGLTWIAPYTVLGIFFFGSDSERWLFVMPALWLAAAALVALRPDRLRVAVVALAWIGLFNFTTGIWPAHRDDWPKKQAIAAGAQLHDGDLVIFPGHSWDEYVSFYAKAKVEPFPIVYYAARDGARAGWERLARDAARVRAHGGHLYAIRIFDDDPDPRGWAELAALGLDRQKVRDYFTARFTVTPVADRDAYARESVVRLDWRRSP